MKTDSVYSNIERCKKDILLARKTFGSIHTTKEQYDQMEKALSMMYLHCPEKIRDIVLSTLNESQQRRLYYELNIW